MNNTGLIGYITGITAFLGNVVIPLLLGLAFLFFVINVVRYFILQGGTDDGQEAAKRLALFGVAAFVIILIFWGMITLLTSSFGFGGRTAPCPDYLAGAINNPCNTNAGTGAGTGPSFAPTGNQTAF